LEETATAGTHLIVEQYGAFVARRSERLRVSVKGEVVAERPLHGLEQLVIASGGVSLSSDAIRACAEEGVQIQFLSSTGSRPAPWPPSSDASGPRTRHSRRGGEAV
jgi:CRISPR/Cas system-associated endonuclease Cas1